MSNSQRESHPKAATIARPRQPGTKRVDAYVPALMVQDLAWGTAEEIEESTKKLYEYAEAVADEFIRWYARNKGKMARWSRGLRLLAILLTAVGGLRPIISSLGWSTIHSLEEANEMIDFEVLYTRTDWRDPKVKERLLQAEKYEILVPDFIPLELIRDLPNG